MEMKVLLWKEFNKYNVKISSLKQVEINYISVTMVSRVTTSRSILGMCSLLCVLKLGSTWKVLVFCDMEFEVMCRTQTDEFNFSGEDLGNITIVYEFSRGDFMTDVQTLSEIGMSEMSVCV